MGRSTLTDKHSGEAISKITNKHDYGGRLKGMAALLMNETTIMVAAQLMIAMVNLER